MWSGAYASAPPLSSTPWGYVCRTAGAAADVTSERPATYNEGVPARRGILFGVLAVALASATPAQASCIPATAAQQRARADVIFDGVALEGATASGVQRFRVTRYLKGSGPRIVRVATGHIRRADGTGSVTSVSIVAARGQRWRIFARGSARRVLQSNVCDGSRPLRR
jgi:hypothetical protein